MVRSRIAPGLNWGVTDCVAAASADWVVALASDCISIGGSVDNCTFTIYNSFASFLTSAMNCAGSALAGKLGTAWSLAQNFEQIGENDFTSQHADEVLEMVENSLKRHRSTSAIV